MSKKKKKAPLPIPEPIGVRTWIPKVGVLMAILLAVIITFYAQSMPSKPVPAKPIPTPVVSVAAVGTVDTGPTPEQERWVREHLLRDCDRIASSYPIESIRAPFASLIQRMARKEVLMHCSAGYLNGTQSDAVALADKHDGKPLIQFFVPAVMDHYRKFSDPDTLDDTVVGILLHEEYHLKHHVFLDRTGQDPKVFLPIEEGEAWWWCVEQVYIPMSRNGRLKLLPSTDSVASALRAYHDARGNPMSPPWMQFSLNAASTESPR